MIRAAIVGLGRWGQNFVNSVRGSNFADTFTGRFAGALRVIATFFAAGSTGGESRGFGEEIVDGGSERECGWDAGVSGADRWV